jgi:uncharacterized RDD family membrane protein YckC
MWARGGGPASEWSHRIAARSIDVAIEIVLFLATTTVVSAITPLRPALNWVVGLLVVAAFETVTVAAWGGTPGKLIAGIRIICLDRPDRRVPLAAAAERGIMVAFFECAVFPLPILVGSIMVSPNRRGLHDRRAHTFVVEKASPPIRSHELARFEAGERPPAPTPFGPTGSIDLRVRARFYRLEGSILLLVLVTAMLAIVSILPILWLVLAAGVAFLIGFVIDETLAVQRHGGTRGHHLAGLRVVDVDTGRWPSTGRALARALVLTMLYVPLLQLGLLIWIVASPRWRGLHDHAGHSVVIRVTEPDPRLHHSPASAAEVAARLGHGHPGGGG